MRLQLFLPPPAPPPPPWGSQQGFTLTHFVLPKTFWQPEFFLILREREQIQFPAAATESKLSFGSDEILTYI